MDRQDVPETIYEDEVVCFIADRYHTEAGRIMERYFEQNGLKSAEGIGTFRLEENEMSILRDMLERNH